MERVAGVQGGQNIQTACLNLCHFFSAPLRQQGRIHGHTSLLEGRKARMYTSILEKTCGPTNRHALIDSLRRDQPWKFAQKSSRQNGD